MNIYILNTENQKVRIEFTEDELLVDKFHQITNGIINKYIIKYGEREKRGG